MTIANDQYLTTAYEGKSFTVGEHKFYPLQTPLDFLLSVEKTKLVPGEQDCAVIAELDTRMESEDAELWLTEDGMVVTLMSNFGGTKIVQLNSKFVPDLLSFNGIFINEGN